MGNFLISHQKLKYVAHIPLSSSCVIKMRVIPHKTVIPQKNVICVFRKEWLTHPRQVIQINKQHFHLPSFLFGGLFFFCPFFFLFCFVCWFVCWWVVFCFGLVWFLVKWTKVECWSVEARETATAISLVFSVLSELFILGDHQHFCLRQHLPGNEKRHACFLEL